MSSLLLSAIGASGAVLEAWYSAEPTVESDETKEKFTTDSIQWA